MGNGNRRGRTRRVTGRFFALVAVVAICAVLIVVFTINNGKNKDEQLPNQPVNAQATQNADDQGEEWGNQEVASIYDLIDDDGDLQPLTDENRIDVDKSNLSVNLNLDPVWRNILILGTDTRNMQKKNLRTDTIMILSVNTQNGRVKLVSLMRDMYLPLVSDKEGSVRYDKLNAASYYGTAYATMKTINECFNMNITDYVLVNFVGAQEAIDILGGIEIDVTEQEREELNHNIKEQAKMMMSYEDWAPEKYNLAAAGEKVHLTGMQAVGYARIRHIGEGDFDRTKRQRTVMTAIFEKAKTQGITQLLKVAKTLMECVDTNMEMTALIEYGTKALTSDANKFEVGGSIPIKGTFMNEVRNNKSALYDVDLETNAQRLYAFIYNE